jgi:pyridoxamine 5'-phosphate oxidase
LVALKRLSVRTFAPDPIHQFKRWFQHAQKAGLSDANAMTLATATQDGRPSARMVLLKEVGPRGFVFFTNYGSRKGREIESNPHAALVFYWRELNRQVRVTGRVEKISDAASDAYFDTRPIGSRFAAMASQQSSVIATRAILEKKAAALEAKYLEKVPPRPINWGGYCVQPDEIEFWQQGPNRLHDRLRYRKTRGGWKLEGLAP